MSDASLPSGFNSRWNTVRQLFTSVWGIIALLVTAIAVLDPPNFYPVVEFAVKALISTLPYIIFAVLLIAGLKAAGAEAVIADAFKGRETRMIMVAALFGGLAPFCSCEVIPFVAGLLALGAPLSAVMAFWLSSPLIDPPTLLITAAALGWHFAIGKAVIAVGLGMFGGFTIKLLTTTGGFPNPLRKYENQGCGCGPNPLSGKPHWNFWEEKVRRTTFNRELMENGLFLLKWLSLAYVLEALLVTYVPASMIAGLVGGEGIAPSTLR